MHVGQRAKQAMSRSLLRARLGSKKFTIVSNNCWGAHIYQQLGRPYETPFVGVFLAPACFLELVTNFRKYINQSLQFATRSRHEYVNSVRDKQGVSYPIGMLGDGVEIQFLHYESCNEAVEKWTRRVARISSDDSLLFFKFCDRDGCNEEQLKKFDQAPVKHKVCFVSRPDPGLSTAVWIPSAQERQVPDGLQLSRISPKYFDAAGWIQGSNGHPRWWQILRCA